MVKVKGEGLEMAPEAEPRERGVMNHE